MKFLIIVLAVAILALAIPLYGQTQPATTRPEVVTPIDEQTLNEISAIRNGMVDALNKGDIDKLLTYVHPDVIVTWANAEVSHGPAEVKQYCQRMLEGTNKRVESVTVSPTIEGRQLYGKNVLISYGTLGDRFKLTDGSDFTLNSRFSSLLVNENGKWMIKGFHASANIFDNPVQGIVIKRVALFAGLIAGAVGLIVGFIAGKLLRRKPSLE
jgi:hypothetical protein